MSLTVRTARDAAVTQALLSLVLAEPALRRLAVYAPLPTEPGGSTLLPALLETDREILLPVLRDDLDLDWAPWSTMRTGRFGLSEPSGPTLGRSAIAGVDLVVVPALAVDRQGNRLGKGGGSYDRALSRTAAPSLALLYPAELVEELPAEPHDRPVSGVIVGYEPAHLYWTKGLPMTHHWHSKYQSAKDGG